MRAWTCGILRSEALEWDRGWRLFQAGLISKNITTHAENTKRDKNRRERHRRRPLHNRADQHPSDFIRKTQSMALPSAHDTCFAQGTAFEHICYEETDAIRTPIARVRFSHGPT